MKITDPTFTGTVITQIGNAKTTMRVPVRIRVDEHKHYALGKRSGGGFKWSIYRDGRCIGTCEHPEPTPTAAYRAANKAIRIEEKSR